MSSEGHACLDSITGCVMHPASGEVEGRGTTTINNVMPSPVTCVGRVRCYSGLGGCSVVITWNDFGSILVLVAFW